MTQKLVEDPLFQLNLVLFMCLPQPPESRVNPVMLGAGYRILKVSPSLGVPLPVLGAVRALEPPVDINRIAKPDVVLQHADGSRFLLIECKCSSFSPGSSTARQAAALLVLCNDLLRDALAGATTEEWQSGLVYLVKAGDEQKMAVCLNELTDTLEQTACAVNPSGVLGLEQREDGVYLNVNTDLIPNHAPGESVRVLAGEPGDCRTLYIIPFDLDVGQPDAYTIQMLQSRIRSTLASMLVTSTEEEPLELDVTAFLRRSVLMWDIWDEWDESTSKGRLLRLTRDYLRDTLAAVKKECGITFSRGDRSFRIDAISKQLKQRIVRFVMSKAFRTGDYESYVDSGEQLELGLDEPKP